MPRGWHRSRHRQIIAAIDVEDRPGDITRLLARQEQRRLDNILFRAIGTQGKPPLDSGFGCRIPGKTRHALGIGDRPGRDRIDANPRRPPLERKATGDHVHSGLGGTGMDLERCRMDSLAG